VAPAAAMANYAAARLSEEELLPESGSPMPAPKRWRLAALVVCVVGAVGAVVGVAWPQRRLTRMQRMSAMTKRFITAFTARELTPLEKVFSSVTDVAWLEDGAPEDWEKMKISAHVRQSEVELGHTQIKVVFLAEEADPPLKDKLEEIKKSINDTIAVEEGPEKAAVFSHFCQIQEEGDDVAIVVTLPPNELGESKSTDEMVEDGLKAIKPEFKASMSFGNTLSGIFDASDEECPLTMFGGVKMHMEDRLAKKFISGAEAAMKESEGGSPKECPMDMIMKAAEAFSSVSEAFTVKYRKTEVQEAWGNMKLPNKGALMGAIVDALEGVPAEVREHIQGLKDRTKGLKTIELSGLPDKWEVVVSFKHVKVAKMLNSFVDKMQEKQDEADAQDKKYLEPEEST